MTAAAAGPASRPLQPVGEGSLVKNRGRRNAEFDGSGISRILDKKDDERFKREADSNCRPGRHPRQFL